MLSLFLLSAAADLMKPARAASPFIGLSGMEYPKDALRRAERGTVLLRITISPEGEPVRCDTQEQNALNKAACRHMTDGRAFLPALGEDGKPAYGVFKFRGRFTIPGTTNPPPVMTGHDLAVTVASLPPGVRDPSYVIILFMLDASGKVGPCHARPSIKEQPEELVALLGGIACGEMAKSPPPVVRDEAGNAVASVHSAEVKFATPAAMNGKAR